MVSSQPFIAAANDEIIDTNNCDMGSYESTCFSDDEWQGESNTIQKKKKQMRAALPTLAAACNRHGVSDQAAATLATAVLQDMQIVHQGDTTQVIDRSKVRRERYKKRGDQATESNTTFCGLYFDGRKDRTIIQTKWMMASFTDKLPWRSMFQSFWSQDPPISLTFLQLMAPVKV